MLESGSHTAAIKILRSNKEVPVEEREEATQIVVG